MAGRLSPSILKAMAEPDPPSSPSFSPHKPLPYQLPQKEGPVPESTELLDAPVSSASTITRGESTTGLITPGKRKSHKEEQTEVEHASDLVTIGEAVERTKRSASGSLSGGDRKRNRTPEGENVTSGAASTNEKRAPSIPAGADANADLDVSDASGCLACGADDDHANLLLCEACNDEYHTYCLDPPLRSVPEGDFFCDKCKPLHAAVESDGLGALVSALPPSYTSRFGEIVWAAGGVGFGWWPACIYDPRLTVGGARQLARKNLGKKHLVYFFECHDAPFTVLGDSKLTRWEEGFLEEYDLGKTARASGKARTTAFEQALQTATIENGKPIELRLDWNHQMTSLPSRPVAGGKKNAQQPSASKKKQKTKAADRNGSDDLDATKKDSGSHQDLTTPRNVGRRNRGGRSDPSPALNDSIVAKRDNLNAILRTLSPGVANAIEPLEDGELFCKILLKLPRPSDGRAAIPDASTALGFIALPSRRAATFANARSAMETDLDDDCLPRDKWKFYIPNLGPVSKKQETMIGPMLEFLRGTTSDARLGDGSLGNPLKIIIVDPSAQ